MLNSIIRSLISQDREFYAFCSLKTTKPLKQQCGISDRKSAISNVHDFCGFFRDGVEDYKEHFVDRSGMKESRFPFLCLRLQVSAI